ncbi:hypothetical protein Leryth_015708 [Lithospermum erythrorhizon]|nr:hypothetical protein Leryth_015708 [Lithospermum erythrorhizon]
MITRNVEFTTLGFGVFLWRFCCGVEIGECLSLIEGVRRNVFSGIDGSIIAVLVVHGLCSQMRLDEAVYVLEELRKRECKPDFMAYRVVTEALRERGKLDEVDNVLKRKRKLGVAPRANEYGRFILSLISHKLIFEAKEIAEVIVSGNFPIEDDVLNALISSVSSVDPCSAVSFVNFMLSKQRFPALPSLIDLSNNLMKHGKCNDLMEMINHLSVKDFFKDVESYKEMIMLMCKMGSVHEAYQLLQEMKRKGINPDVEAYNIILEACCREDKLRPARRLWDEMFVNGYVVDRKSYCILISKFSEVGEVDEAYRMFCQMIGNGIVPDRSTYLAVLEGFCKAKDPEKALLVFGKSVEQDLTLSQHILGEFIFCLCKEGYFLDASNLLRDSKVGSGQLDSHVRLLKLLGNAREVPLAMEHIKWIRQRSLQELHGVHAALSASLHSSMELDQIIMFCELQKCSSITSLPSPSLPFDQVTSTKSDVSFQE